MILLADWPLSDGNLTRRVELYWGDLSYLGPKDAVDLLVVSAFPNDYIPTPTSLIGALHRNGISLHKLSFDKEQDLREDFSCWLSRPVGVKSFKRILCIESGWRGTPPQLADDLFRAIVPVSLTVSTRTVAMPLIGAGDQGYSPAQMLESILSAAIGWLKRGAPIEVLKIVVYSQEAAHEAKQRFIELRDANSPRSQRGRQWDVFLSYSHENSALAEHAHRALLAVRPEARVFYDREALAPGTSWLMQIAEAIDSASCVLALYTPAYWNSPVCKDELTAAYTRQTKERQRLLFPAFCLNTRIPSFFEGLQYIDCREGDLSKLTSECRSICQAIGT